MTDPQKFTAKIESQAVEPIQYKSQVYRADMPAEMTVEDLLKPMTWINVKRKFPQIMSGNLIQCVKEDMSLFVELFVIGVSGDQIFLKLLRSIALEEAAEDKSESAYLIKWCGPVKKYCLIRKSDNEELRSGFTSRLEAQECQRNNY